MFLNSYLPCQKSDLILFWCHLRKEVKFLDSLEEIIYIPERKETRKYKILRKWFKGLPCRVNLYIKQIHKGIWTLARKVSTVPERFFNTKYGWRWREKKNKYNMERRIRGQEVLNNSYEESSWEMKCGQPQFLWCAEKGQFYSFK